MATDKSSNRDATTPKKASSGAKASDSGKASGSRKAPSSNKAPGSGKTSGKRKASVSDKIPNSGQAPGSGKTSGSGNAPSRRKTSDKRPAYEGEAARIAAKEFDRALEARYPEAECSLAYEGDPWRLLVMARLSAQCTDERVNKVCRELFDVFPDASAMAAGELSEIERIIHSCGLHHMKAISIKEASAIIVDEHAGEIPRDMEALLALPGVGRKIANLVLGDVYGLGGIVADTHFMRICSRLGFTPAGTKDPLLTERVMDALIPKDRQSALCHRAVLFGREVCDARAPRCDQCELAGMCVSASQKDGGKTF